ncbi:MAG: bifunctional oligoribonuclease/PAP phosphatase NrnA [Thermodesulfobacteriota bacterium]|nr:bifunctional oligoribonuclease/PAP phosphatase NrnA [Thermodesulfobacteriota bacterium]
MSRRLLNKIASVLREGRYFLLITHEDPDADGIGSMLALGRALINSGKDVILLSEEPVPAPLNLLKGSDIICQRCNLRKDFDALIVLDCGKMKRMGRFHKRIKGHGILINIDHHASNDFFGDLDLVDANSSSTAELVFRVIEAAGLSVDRDIAENIFAAIQADTGCFTYDNTTPDSLRIAAEMMSYGVRPWELSRKIMYTCSVSRLKLLEMALRDIEFYNEGKIGVMTLSKEMFEKAGAYRMDSEGFVDYPRFVSGVEIGVLIRQTGKDTYKFSLRSNNTVDVGRLASRFGGGGHMSAAGFERQGPIGVLKRDLLEESNRSLDGIPN